MGKIDFVIFSKYWVNGSRCENRVKYAILLLLLLHHRVFLIQLLFKPIEDRLLSLF